MAATNRSIVYAAQIIHIGSGTSIAAGNINPSSDVSTALSSTNLLRYDRCDAELFISCTGSISSASNSILLLRRDLNFDGTNDEPVPGTAISYSGHLVGNFVAQPFTAASTAYYQLLDVPLADQCEFYLQNSTNQTIAAGWTLKITPKTDSFA